ncbi:MAG: hypothetical protein GX221_07410 [Candidatus Riflebacteria bacterium]|nr:hypothetical protein [Candidatus Riflebacteria bacterium]
MKKTFFATAALFMLLTFLHPCQAARPFYRKDTGSGLRVDITISQKEILAGEPATFTVTLKNVSFSPQTLKFDSGQTWDLLLQKGAKTLYKWSSCYDFSWMGHSITLRPGETRTQVFSWNSFTPNNHLYPQGTYEAFGVVQSTPQAIISSNPVKFKIIAPIDVSHPEMLLEHPDIKEISLPKLKDGKPLKWQFTYTENRNIIKLLSIKQNEENYIYRFKTMRSGKAALVFHAYTEKSISNAAERHKYFIRVE